MPLLLLALLIFPRVPSGSVALLAAAFRLLLSMIQMVRALELKSTNHLDGYF